VIAALGPPRVTIRPVGAAERDGPLWRIAWAIGTAEPLGVRVALINAPHSRFRADPTPVDAPVREGAEAIVPLRVKVGGGPESEIENAFVILTIDHAACQWRFLVRVRVTIASTGAPLLRVETITSQRVGFSAEV
jgi:hypothetical protein